jgi:hypothetical protein
MEHQPSPKGPLILPLLMKWASVVASSLHYTRVNGDLEQDNLHWLQVVRTNGPTTEDLRLGFDMPVRGIFYYVDDAFGKNMTLTSPLYDEVPAATAHHMDFIDVPSREFVRGFDGNPVDFQAQVFLATMTGKSLTIYDGVWWGFSNSVVPEPTSLVLFGTGMLLTVIASAARAARGQSLPLGRPGAARGQIP